MMNNLKGNTKIKIIAILSSLALWLYVMQVIDPTGDKVFDNIPVIITNVNSLEQEGLVVYPKEEITVNVRVEGTLSDIRKINKDAIRVTGQILDPKEGNNVLDLKSNIGSSLKSEITNYESVKLERIVSVNKDVEVNISKGSGYDISLPIEKDIDKVSVEGPRSQVNKVKKVVANLSTEDKTKDFEKSLALVAVDMDGDKIEGVKLGRKSVKVKVSLLKTKTVAIKGVYNGEIGELGPKLSQETIVIKGKSEIIDNIDSIETKPINIDNLEVGSYTPIDLNIPEGVSTNTKSVSVTLSNEKIHSKEISYLPSDIELTNNKDNITIDQLDIPDKIIVSIDYLVSVGDIDKADIKVYIDLSSRSEDNTYKISYSSDKKIENININPEYISMKE